MRMDLSAFAAYIPLGLLGLVRWASWLIRRVPASLYRPARIGHFEPLTIVVPVYQEDQDIFRQALESWLVNDVLEVICVIDQTDTACLRIAREYPVRVIPTDVPGKRDALRRGWEAARTRLVALVECDSIWAGDVAVRVCVTFADPRVGGVGTRQTVAAPATVWEHLNDMYLDYRYFDEIASQTVVGRAVSCLSGRTAVYRRSLLLRHSERFMNETVLGVPCMSGDDKRLTTLVLEGGHRTVLQRSAVQVVLASAKNGEILAITVDGPWFHIQLPPGTYEVKATFKSQIRLVKNLRVMEDQAVKQTFIWGSRRKTEP